MKKVLLITMMLICGMTFAMAQKQAEIKFEKLTHNFGKFSEKWRKSPEAITPRRP